MGAVTVAFGAESLQNFGATLTRYLPMLYRVALRQLGNHEDAEDAVQDALLCAFKHISQFENRSHISTWLYRIVINSARMQVRRQRNRKFLHLDEMSEDDSGKCAYQLVDSGLNPEQACFRAELHENVQQLISELPPRLRDAIELRHINGLSTDESAWARGITQSAMKSRAKRGRTQLSVLLADRGISDVRWRHAGFQQNHPMPGNGSSRK